MSIRSLRTLIAIAETGSFAAAANRVFITQGAVSTQIKALEEELGLTLFDRNRRPPELTEAGQLVVANARELVREYDSLRHVLDATDEVEGKVALGSIPSTLTGITPRIMKAMQRRFPKLKLTLSTGYSEELFSAVEHGDLDAAIVSEFTEEPKNVVWRPFMREPIILIAPLDAPEMSAEALLAEYPFIRFNPRTWVGRLIDETLRKRGIQVQDVMQMETIEAVGAMVAQGFGVALIPRRRIGTPILEPVRSISMPRPTIYTTLGLVYRESDSRRAVLGALQAEVDRIAAGA